MSLMSPRWGFKNHASYQTQNGQLTADAEGPLVTCHTTAHTKGNTVGILTAVDFDVHCIAVSTAGNNNSTNSMATLVDVMYDPAGGTSWSVLINNLLSGQTLSIQQAVCSQDLYIFPLYVKSGASFGVRGQSATSGGVQFSGQIWVWGEPSRPEMWWCGQGVESLGIVTATSTGTVLTPNNGSFSTFATIGTSTMDYGAYQMGCGPSTDSALLARDLLFRVGIGSAIIPGSPHYGCTTEGTEKRCWHQPMAPIWCDIPASTTFQGSIYSSGTTDTQAMAIYGVY